MDYKITFETPLFNISEVETARRDGVLQQLHHQLPA